MPPGSRVLQLMCPGCLEDSDAGENANCGVRRLDDSMNRQNGESPVGNLYHFGCVSLSIHRNPRFLAPYQTDPRRIHWASQSDMSDSWATKSARSLSSRKSLVRSIPRTITWCGVSGASRRRWRGIAGGSPAHADVDCNAFRTSRVSQIRTTPIHHAAHRAWPSTSDWINCVKGRTAA